MAVIIYTKQELITARFNNTPEGIKRFNKWICQNKVVLADNLLVIENSIFITASYDHTPTPSS